MPVYLITLHGYGTHLPDDPAGSYHWKRGYQPPDRELAARYREKQRASPVHFTPLIQRLLLDEIHRAAAFQRLRLLGVAIEVTHVHVVVAWRDARRVRSTIKSSLSRRLNREVGRKTWFSLGGACTRVWNDEHLEHLLKEYLPQHRGLQWYAEIER